MFLPIYGFFIYALYSVRSLLRFLFDVKYDQADCSVFSISCWGLYVDCMFLPHFWRMNVKITQKIKEWDGVERLYNSVQTELIL